MTLEIHSTCEQSFASATLSSHLDYAFPGRNQEDGSVVVGTGGLVQQLEAGRAGAGEGRWVGGREAQVTASSIILKKGC